METRTKYTAQARTKTVATVGPASVSQPILERLILAGADVFRINMAHGSRSDHQTAIENIRAASAKTGLPAAILVDLAGPKIRLGQLTQNPLTLENDQEVKFIRGETATRDDELTCIYETLIDEVEQGDEIILADGIARLEVTHKNQDQLFCRVVDGGQIRSRQGVNLPGTKLSVPALGPIDKDNANWAANLGVEYVSLSFVRNAQEVEELKSILRSQGSQALVVAKIEKREALLELDAIVEAAGAVMVARGDLGVEIPIEQTPGEQKRIIGKCLQHRKPVIVATQMLESMHTSKQPTRAEVTDVANAILDGADACMLSGETAIGEYPVESVAMMNRIMKETEKVFETEQSRMTAHSTQCEWPIADAIVFGAAQIANRVSAKMVVIASSGIETGLSKSKQRDFIPTLCVTDVFQTFHQMSLFWGVIPVLSSQKIEQPQLQPFVNAWAKENLDLQVGDRFVVVVDTDLLPGVHDSLHVARVD
ncbi:MAG: pyruvate kinase [Planctomycetota bacterium]